MKHINLSSALAPLLGEIDMCAPRLFCTKFNPEQLLFEQFFYIIGNFGKVQPKSGFTFPFQYNVIFETYQFFESLASLLWEIDMCARWLFCTKFNSEPLSFEQFFNIIGNFGSVQPWSESTSSFQYKHP